MSAINSDITDKRVVAEEIFRAGIVGVLPENLISAMLILEDNVLKINDLSFELGKFKNIRVLGAGKASGRMAEAVEKILGERITGGQVIVKYGFGCRLRYIKITEAGHPVPDKNGFAGTKEIVRIAGMAAKDDLVICLISGGGSSLLTDLPEGCSAEEIMTLNDLLVKSGASISEINAVRKHLSSVKGGQLARIINPATLLTLIVSDVPGDQLEVVASGPTVPDSTTFQQAMDVLIKYNLKKAVSQSVLRHLEDGASGLYPETPKPEDPVFNRTFNILAGSNKTALEASRLKALEYNINAVIIDDQLQGEVMDIAEYLVDTSLKFMSDVHEVKPVCLLFGGETTVRMSGNGKGGRNQHLALLASVALKDHPGITILAAGTDGNDGNTDVAGAIVDSETVRRAVLKKTEPEKYIDSFDSYHFFRSVGGHVITGPTYTNVMDMIVIIVD